MARLPRSAENQTKIIGQAASRGPSGKDQGRIEMSADHEWRLLARAEELDDTSDLAEEVTMILGGARAARLDPGALGGLTGAALALGEDGRAVYAAGPRGLMTAFADDAEFLGAVAEAEDEVAGLLAAARELQAEATAAVAAARAAHAAARAVPSGTAEQAEARAAALADAAGRIALARDAVQVTGTLAGRLERAACRLAAVPEDLGETYEAVYALLRRGGVMPKDGDWLSGDDPPGQRPPGGRAGPADLVHAVPGRAQPPERAGTGPSRPEAAVPAESRS
jgi:hypothetical protein